MRFYKPTKRDIPSPPRVNECFLGILIIIRVLLYALEKYTRISAEDIRDLQNNVNEIDIRNRKDFDQVHGSLGSIYNGQKDILRFHEDSKARHESQAQGNDLSPARF